MLLTGDWSAVAVWRQASFRLITSGPTAEPRGVCIRALDRVVSILSITWIVMTESIVEFTGVTGCLFSALPNKRNNTWQLSNQVSQTTTKSMPGTESYSRWVSIPYRTGSHQTSRLNELIESGLRHRSSPHQGGGLLLSINSRPDRLERIQVIKKGKH